MLEVDVRHFPVIDRRRTAYRQGNTEGFNILWLCRVRFKNVAQGINGSLDRRADAVLLDVGVDILLRSRGL